MVISLIPIGSDINIPHTLYMLYSQLRSTRAVCQLTVHATSQMLVEWQREIICQLYSYLFIIKGAKGSKPVLFSVKPICYSAFSVHFILCFKIMAIWIHTHVLLTTHHCKVGVVGILTAASTPNTHHPHSY